jgi:hypothetical protein
MSWSRSESQEGSSSYGGGTLDSDMYVIWMQLGGDTYLYDTWIDSFKAIEECRSLNKRDESAFYYVTYMGVIL